MKLFRPIDWPWADSTMWWYERKVRKIKPDKNDQTKTMKNKSKSDHKLKKLYQMITSQKTDEKIVSQSTKCQES